MQEKIVVKIEVDGEEVAPIEMGKWGQDSIHKDDAVFFSTGHVFNKERTFTPYEYTIRISRSMLDEEKLDG